MELREVLRKLKEAGKVTDEDLREILGPSDELKQISTGLHTMLCTKDHNEECGWQQEIIFDDFWEMKSHVKWIEKAEQFLEEFNLTEGEALLHLSTAINIIKDCPEASLHVIVEYVQSCQDRAGKSDA